MIFFKKYKIVPLVIQRTEKNYKTTECSICFDEFKDKNIFKLPCGHTYHYNCIMDWFDKEMTCPLCRTKFKYIKINRNLT